MYVSLAILNVSLMRAHLRTCPGRFYYTTTGIQSGNETTKNSNASTSAENDSAMAGPAGPVPAPMPIVKIKPLSSVCRVGLQATPFNRSPGSWQIEKSECQFDINHSVTAKLGHTGARTLATRGCALPVQALLKTIGSECTIINRELGTKSA